MPIAATGPRLLFEFSSEKLRHSRPRMTVAAGGDDRRRRCRFQAVIIASNRLLVLVQFLAIAEISSSA